MTAHRARKRNARFIAEANDVRHPEAAYLADNRRLRLPDGTIHNFADGPIRFVGDLYSDRNKRADDLHKIAVDKGWRVISFAEHLPGGEEDLLLYLREETTLVIAEKFEGVHHGLDHVVDDFDAGLHPELNIVVVREAIGDEPAIVPSPGRTFFLESPAGRPAPKPAPVKIAEPSHVELLKARIAFARRYANFLSAGLNQHTAVGFVMSDVDVMVGGPSGAIAKALRSAQLDLAQGANTELVWGPHRDVFGSHLVQMLILSAQMGGSASILRDAAETLEADMRLSLH